MDHETCSGWPERAHSHSHQTGQPTSESERVRAADSSVELATGVRHILEVNKRMNRRLRLVLKSLCSRHKTVVIEVPSFLSHAVELGKETKVARKSFGDFEPVDSKHGGCGAPNNENWIDDLAPPKAAAWWRHVLRRRSCHRPINRSRVYCFLGESN